MSTLHGVMPLSQTLDSPGPIAKTVLDCLIMFDVLDGCEGWQIIQNMEKDDGIYALQREFLVYALGVFPRASASNAQMMYWHLMTWLWTGCG